MLSVSDLYREILEEPDHYKEVRAVIGDTEQTVVNCSIIASVNESVAVGGTRARQLDLEILPNGLISDRDSVEIFVRLSSKDGRRKSEWIPKGTYLIDTAPMDAETGVMSIHAFDAMLKMEQPFLSADDYENQKNWPQTPSAVMNRIASAIGVPLDSRTQLNDAFTVPFPTKKSLEDNATDSAANGPPYILNIDSKIIHRRSCRRVADIAPENTRRSDSAVTDLEAAGYRICRICRPSDGEPEPEPDTSASLSMRVVAGYVAAMQCGNWVITDENRLRLLPFEIFASSLNMLSAANGGGAILFGNTVILV